MNLPSFICFLFILLIGSNAKTTQKLQCCPQTCPKCIPLEYRKSGKKEPLPAGDDVQIRRRFRRGREMKAGFGELLQRSDDERRVAPRQMELFDPNDIYQERFLEHLQQDYCEQDCPCSNCVCCFTETILCSTTTTCAATIFDTTLITLTKTSKKTLTSISSVTAKILFTVTNSVFFTSTLTATSTAMSAVLEYSYYPITYVTNATLFARTVLTVNPNDFVTTLTSFYPEVSTTLSFTLTSTIYVSMVPSFVNATNTITMPGYRTNFYPGTIIKKMATVTINVPQTLSITQTSTTLETQYPEEFITQVVTKRITERFTDTISKCVGQETIRYTPVRTIVKRKNTALPSDIPCCPRHGCGRKCDC